MLVHSLTLGRDLDTSDLYDDEVEALMSDMGRDDWKHVPKPIQSAIESAVRANRHSVSVADDEYSYGFEGWE